MGGDSKYVHAYPVYGLHHGLCSSQSHCMLNEKGRDTRHCRVVNKSPFSYPKYKHTKETRFCFYNIVPPLLCAYDTGTGLFVLGQRKGPVDSITNSGTCVTLETLLIFCESWVKVHFGGIGGGIEPPPPKKKRKRKKGRGGERERGRESIVGGGGDCTMVSSRTGRSKS